MSSTSFLWLLMGIATGVIIYFFIDLFTGKLDKNSNNLNNK